MGVRKFMKSIDRNKTYTITTARRMYEIGNCVCFHSREQFRGNYPKFTTDYKMKKYGTPIANTHCYFSVSDFYSTSRPKTLQSL